MIPDGFQYFLDDFWNLQKIHQIWTRAHRTYHKNASKNTRHMDTSLQNIIFHISTFRKSKIPKNARPYRTSKCVCVLLFLQNKFRYVFLIIFCEDEDRENMKLGLIKFTKSWICMSYLSKKHEMECW